MTQLKEIRTEKQLTQQEAAKRLGVSLRSYITYVYYRHVLKVESWQLHL